MAFTIKTYLPDPIIVVTLVPPHDPTVEIMNAGREIEQFAAGIQGPVFSIVDMSAVRPSFSQVVDGLDRSSRQWSQIADPRIHGLFVGSTEMIKFAVESAAQQQYGGPKMHLFSSVDEALAHARAELAKVS